ncbi:MAG: TonB-dependent receptor [Candidatus Kapaibacteriota bacterium]
MFRIITFLIFVNTLILKSAVPLEIKGTVLDSRTKKPIAEAKIILHNNNNKILANCASNANGEFATSVPNEFTQLFIEIQKEGYLSFRTKIKVDSNFSSTFTLEPKEYKLPGLVVTSEKSKNYTLALHNYSATIEEKELIKSISSTLGLTLKNETEIFVRSMGPATSKPVFRGLSLEYLNIFENDLPVKDLSATAPDHSTAIDPLNFNKIEMIRGPRLLIYSPIALGGMINLLTRDFLVEKIPKSNFNGTAVYESAYNAFGSNLKWEVPLGNFFTAGSGGIRTADDMKSGKGTVANTYFKSKSANIIAGMKNNPFSFLLEGSLFRTQYGVPGGFVGAHPKGVDIDLGKNTINFKSIYHLHTFIDIINFNFSRTYYHHIEYEKNKAVGAEFLIKNYHANLNLNFLPGKLVNENTFGFTFEKGFNDYGGYVFTPPSNSILLSTYFFQNIRIGDHYIDYSIRFDHKEYYPKMEENLKKNPPKSRIFNNISFSVLVMHKFGNNSSLGLNFGKNERFPTLEELYSNGPHLAAYSFEIGNNQLKKEEAYFGELSYAMKTSEFELNTSGYWYEFTNYLYPLNTGEINVAQLLPIYQITNTYARLWGLSLNANWEPIENLNFSLHFALSRGINKTTSTNLPMMPPTKGLLVVSYKLKKIEIELLNNFAFAQKRVGENEAPTPGYTIFSLNFRYPFTFLKFISVVNINIDNILNTTYFNHLSRIKSIYPEPGRNIRLLFTLFY